MAFRIRLIFALDIGCILNLGQGLRGIGFVPPKYFFAPRGPVKWGPRPVGLGQKVTPKRLRKASMVNILTMQNQISQCMPMPKTAMSAEG